MAATSSSLCDASQADTVPLALSGEQAEADWELIRAHIWAGADPAALAGTRWAHEARREHLSMRLVRAAARGDDESTRALLNLGADPNAEARQDDFMTPLIWAARCGQANTVATLLDAGADPNLAASYPLRVDETITNSTPLIWSAASGALSVVRFLLLAGADPNAAEILHRYEGGAWKEIGVYRRPIAAAASPEIVEMLLAGGARRDGR